MDCKISVIVPVYKVRDRIIRTLESLKDQTFEEFEVLFIDDGSPDDSSEFADNYLRDSNVSYRIIKKENFTSFDICKEVLNLHSLNLVGLVPLCITEHQLVHDGVRFIPLTSTFGKIKEFVDIYFEAIDDNLIEKYNELVEMTEKLEKEESENE